MMFSFFPAMPATAGDPIPFAGSGGVMPAMPDFTIADDKFGGFYVTSNDMKSDGLGGTRCEVNFHFPTPASLSATGLTLQCSTDNGSTWSPYLHEGDPCVTGGGNAQISIPNTPQAGEE